MQYFEGDQPSMDMGVNYFETNPECDQSYDQGNNFDGENFETTQENLFTATAHKMLPEEKEDGETKSSDEEETDMTDYELKRILESDDIDMIKKEYSRENLEKKQFRKQMFEVQALLKEFERMKEDYEKLYGEFLMKSIKVEKEKMALVRQMSRVNKVVNAVTKCDRQCLASWADHRQLTRKRIAVLVSGATCVLFIFVMIIVKSLSAPPKCK